MSTTSSSITTSAPGSSTCARLRASGDAISASIASASRNCARSFKGHADRLVVGGAVRAVDRDGAQPRRQILADEHVIATVGRLSFPALMHTKRVGMRHAGIETGPDIDELWRAVDEPFGEARAQRILGRQVEVTADEGARRSGHAPVRTFLLASSILAVTFAVQLAQALDLRGAMAARVVLQMRGDDAQRPERRFDYEVERHARHAWDVGRRPRQRVSQHAADGQARGDDVAEALAHAVGAREVDGGRKEHLVVRKLAAQ